MTVALILLFFILGLGGVLIALARDGNRKLKGLKARIAEQYRPDVVHYGFGGSFIGFRFEDDCMVYGDLTWDKSVPMSALKAVEVRKDGVTLTRTNRGSQLAGAALGGLAFGGVGALIGGLSGSTTATERLKSLGLAFVVADQQHPFHEVTFGVWAGTGVPANGLISAQAVSDLDRIRAHALAGQH